MLYYKCIKRFRFDHTTHKQTHKRRTNPLNNKTKKKHTALWISMEKAALLLAHVAATVVITIYLNMHAILINVWVYNICTYSWARMHAFK